MTKRQGIITVTLNPAIDLTCSIPEFKTGAVNRVSGSRTDAGGKGVNIARLLRVFDLPVIATGFLGQDNPHIFEKLFREREITDQFIRVPGETRTGIKILDDAAHTTTDINFPGLTPTSVDFERLLNQLTSLAATARIVIIAGSLPATLPPQAVGELVKVAQKAGASVFVDTSGPALSHAIHAGPSLIKPNQDELGEYLGRPLSDLEDILREAQQLVRRGIDTIIVSLGSRGALFVNRDQALLTAPPRIKPVSTVGAGDAMIGSFAAGLLTGLSFADSARLATAVSAAVVTLAGPGLDTLATAEQLNDQVQIKQVYPQGGHNE